MTISVKSKENNENSYADENRDRKSNVAENMKYMIIKSHTNHSILLVPP